MSALARLGVSASLVAASLVALGSGAQASAAKVATQTRQTPAVSTPRSLMRSAQLGRAHMLLKTTDTQNFAAPAGAGKASSLRTASTATANSQCLTTDYNGDCPTADQNMVYNGGPLLTTPAVYVVTFSTSSNAETSTDTSGFVSGTLASGNGGLASTGLIGAINTIENSSWSSWWQSEYSTPNYTLGAGQYAGSIIVNNATVANGSLQTYCSQMDTTTGNCTQYANGIVIDDSDIQNALTSALSTNTALAAAAANPNAIFVTMFRADQVITYGQAAQVVAPENSMTAFCGYHANIAPDSITPSTPSVNLNYVVLPNEAGSGGCQFTSTSSSDFDNFTPILSHELAETQTDPQQTGSGSQSDGTGWIAPLSGTDYEIGDNCESSPYVVDGASMTQNVEGYWLQDIWSNEAQGCLSGQLTPTLSLQWTSPSVVQASLTAPDASTGQVNSLPSAPLVFEVMNGSTVVTTHSATTSACSLLSNSRSFTSTYPYLSTPYYSCSNSGTASWTVPSLTSDEVVEVTYSGVYPGSTNGLPSGSTETGAFAAASATIAPASSSYVLSVTQSGSGSVSSNPVGISLSAAGSTSASFSSGSQVTLSESPAASYQFSGWSGTGCSGTAPTCTLTMNQARSVTATFIPTYTLSLSQLGSGSVTSNPAGLSISTPGSQEYSFPSGSQVTLTAQASAGSTFSSWSGACSGTALTCTVTMSQAQSVGATFVYASSLLASWTTGTTLTVDLASGGPLSGATVSVLADGSIIATAATNGEGVADLSVFREPAGTVETISYAGDQTHAPAQAQVIAPLVGPLTIGMHLSRNQCFFQPNGANQLCLNQGGDLVEISSDAATLFDAEVTGGTSATLLANGNLVVTSASGQMLWSSRTAGLGVTQLTISSAGQVALLDSTGQAWWTSTRGTTGVLASAHRHGAIPRQALGLNLGQRVGMGSCIFSLSGAAMVCVSVSGNVTATDSSGHVMWNAHTSGQGVTLWLKSTGQLVIVNAAGKQLWTNGKSIKGAHELLVADTGALHLTAASGKILWTSTKGR